MENTNEKPTVAQRLETLADKIGADVHKLVDEFEAFVEREIAAARGETVDNADKGVEGTGTNFTSTAVAGGAAGGAGGTGEAGTASQAGTGGAGGFAADPNAAAAGGDAPQAPTDGEKTAV